MLTNIQFHLLLDVSATNWTQVEKVGAGLTGDVSTVERDAYRLGDADFAVVLLFNFF